MTDASILIATNSTETSDAISLVLKEKYKLICVHSIEEFFAEFNSRMPDLAVIGVALRNKETASSPKDGYEVCTAVKKNPAHSSVPLILLSASNSSEIRLAAYEAGADEFISDPRDGRSILHRADKLLHDRKEKERSMEQAQSAVKVAMEAMTNSSELGKLIQLLRAVHQIEKQQPLADAIRDSISYFNLSCSVMIRAGTETFSGCKKGSMEASLMDRFQSSGQRMTHMGNRTLINSDKVVMLIKNMPVDEETRYGRFKDLLVMIADVASDRAAAIEAGHPLEMKHQRVAMLKDIIQLAEECVERSNKDIGDYSTDLMNAIRDMINAQDDLMPGLGLDDDQEEKLRTLANNATDRIESASCRTEALGASLQNLVIVLRELLDRQ